jgi:hypothetical protein
MIRAVDSSLLDEWERMRDPNWGRRLVAERSQDAGVDLRPPGAEEAAADITRDAKAFTTAIRNHLFTFLRGLAIGDFEAALATLDAEPEKRRTGETGPKADVAVSPIHPLTDSEGNAWTAARLAQLMEEYHASHRHLCLDPEARNIRHTYVTPSEDKQTWRVQQMLVDPDGHNDWVAEFEVDLLASRQSGEPVLRLRRIGALV